MMNKQKKERGICEVLNIKYRGRSERLQSEVQKVLKIIRKAKVENEKEIAQKVVKNNDFFQVHKEKDVCERDRRAFKTWQRKIIERKARYCLKYSMHFLHSCSEKKVVMADTGVNNKHKFP